jgi:transcriptional regulator with XRE-family HTH domain
MARQKPELKAIGRSCAKYRREVLGYTQGDVARELGVSVSLVCQFEKGRTDSGKLLWWYLEHGFHPVEDTTVCFPPYKWR